MSCYQYQNNDNISKLSISSSSISNLPISTNNEKHNLESQYKSLTQTLDDLRTKVENITQKLNEDSKKKSKFESFDFIEKL